MPTDDVIAILAVDDNAANLLALEAIFADSGIEVVRARSGEEALLRLCQQEFAVVLMDAHMPVMDGFETARLMRQGDCTFATPIIFLTATHKDAFHTTAGYDVGAVDYILKPLVPEVLRAKVAVFVELFKKNLELRALNSKLEVLTLAADKARDQALAALRFKSEFLANMSHEIRTPMNGILGMIEILLNSGLSERQQEYAATAREAGRSLLSVINEILDLSKMEAGKLSLQLMDFEPVKLLEGIAELLSAPASQRKLSLVTFIDPQLPFLLHGDPGRLRQIIMNLGGNAIKFSDHGEVTISARVKAQTDDEVTVHFSVRDCGVGLDADEIERLFEPFEQSARAATTNFLGTGLGLSISKRLVDLMGGEIGVISEKDQGATFWFSVPLSRTPLVLDTPALVGNLAGVKVLAVENQPGAREALHQCLVSLGARADSVSGGKEALDLLRMSVKTEPYQLALISLALPGMDGLQLSRAIREDDCLKDTKLILITCFGKRESEEKAVWPGFDGYLTKPIKQSHLLDTITAVLASDARKSDKLPDVDAADIRCETASRPELILIAEDHAINQQVALLLLQELGFEAHVADDGSKAVEATLGTPYSLIFMDCQMPVMDGFEATSAIRRLDAIAGKRTPIVAMTAHAIEGNKEKCLAAGMDDYISKPVDPDQLKAVLNRWLPRRDAQQPGALASQVCAQPVARSNQLNIEALKAKVGEEGIVRLLSAFLVGAAGDLKKMQAPIHSRDRSAALEITHAHRGVFGALCADNLCALCGRLEASACKSDWEEADLLLKQFETAFEALKEEAVLLIEEAESAQHQRC